MREASIEGLASSLSENIKKFKTGDQADAVAEKTIMLTQQLQDLMCQAQQIQTGMSASDAVEADIDRLDSLLDATQIALEAHQAQMKQWQNDLSKLQE